MALSNRPNSEFASQLSEWNKKFNFDWNNHTTFEEAKKIFPEVNTFISDNKLAFKDISSEQAQAAGQLLHKFAVYQLHISRKTDEDTLNWLKRAEEFFQIDRISNQNELDWVRLQTAFLYQQRMARSKVSNESELKDFDGLVKDGAVYYTHVLKRNLESASDQEKEIIAYGFAISALTKYEASKKVPVAFKNADDLQSICRAKNINDAIEDYETAVSIYESIKNRNPNDFQYLRVLNRLAMMYLEIGERDKAKAIFEKLDELWDENKELANPYVSRFHDVVGDDHLEKGKYKIALERYEKGLSLQKEFDGEALTNDVIKLTSKVDAVKILLKYQYFDRADIHTADQDNQKKLNTQQEPITTIRKDMKKLQGIFDANINNPFFSRFLLRDMSKVLDIFHNFYTRDVTQAPIYANHFVKLSDRSSLDYMQAVVDAAFALTIHGAHADIVPFLAAKEVVEEFRRNNIGQVGLLLSLQGELREEVYQHNMELLSAENITINIYSAFIDRYIALMHHRSAVIKPEVKDNTLASLTLAEEEMNKAVCGILNVLSEQEALFEVDNNLGLDLAESRHILSVIRTKQAALATMRSNVLDVAFNAAMDKYDLFTAKELMSKRDAEREAAKKYTAQSETELMKAIGYWNDFNERTGAVHPISIITKQAYGVLLTVKGEFVEARRVLKETIESQIAFNANNKFHADVGKTMHFYALAIAAHCKGAYAKGELQLASMLDGLARKAFNETLEIKRDLFEKDPKKDPFLYNQTFNAFESYKADVAKLAKMPAPQNPRAQGIFGGSTPVTDRNLQSDSSDLSNVTSAPIRPAR